jgi:hypothetical protein
MNYFIDIQGKIAGPYTISQVKTLYESGKIEESFFYSTEESKDWMPLTYLIPTFDVKYDVSELPTIPQPQPSVVVNNNVMSNNQGFLTPIPYIPHKSKSGYQILALLLGGIGIHNIYVGRTDVGIIQFLLTSFTLGMAAPFVWMWGIR